MKQLIIDENKWVNGGNNHPGMEFPYDYPENYAGRSALLNDKGNQCCLGFYAKSCKLTDKEIMHVSALCSLPSPIKDKIPQKVFKFYGNIHEDWEQIAIDINDDSTLTLKSRKLRLISHFKKIDVKLSFIKTKK